MRQSHRVVLALITLLGGVLRFYELGEPRVWLDEALSFSRVCGTWDQMFAILRNDGFMPLHYMLTWLLAQVTYLTPGMLRLIPAVCGTIMVPAMYLLARQMTGRKQAMLAALLTACSAYLLSFSRDAKMYVQAWSFATLFAALVLMWMRPGRTRRTSEVEGGLKSGVQGHGERDKARRWWWQCLLWPAWVISGTAAVWFHGSAMVVVGMAVVFMLTTWNGPWWRWLGRWVFFVAGIGIIAGSCWWYYQTISQWHVRSGGIAPGLVAPGAKTQGEDEAANWERSGLGWVPIFHRERTPVQVARHSLSSYLLGWEWPAKFELDEKDPDGEFTIPRWTVAVFSTSMGVVALACLIGLFPWRKRAGLTALKDDAATRAWPVTALWLSGWMLLPMYAFYCRSFPDFASPMDWVRHVGGLLGTWWGAVVISMLSLGTAASRWRWLRALLWLMAVGLMIVSVWRTPTWVEYEWLASWWSVWTHPMMLGLAVVLIGALAWQRCGETFAQRGWALLALTGLVVTLLIWCGVVYEVIWLSWVKAQAMNLKWVVMWWPRYLGVIQPALLIGLAILLLRLPTAALRWSVIGLLLAINLGTFFARVHMDTDAPWRETANDLWQVQRERGTSRLVGYQVRRQARDAWSIKPIVESIHGKYYYCVAGRLLPSPQELRSWRFSRRLQGNYTVAWDKLGSDITGQPTTNRLIVWERYEPGPKPRISDDDPYLQQLGTSWRLEEQRLYRVREHHSRSSREWNWQQREWLWRKVYVKE